jgi:peptidoglycan/xylan/chitin deacetylase (PgdA/CDA1 family)
VVITFDDGYADNLHNAKPLLERYDIPATVFVTTGHIGHEREFWGDELDRLLLQPSTLPELLGLSINGSPYQWELGEVAHYTVRMPIGAIPAGMFWRKMIPICASASIAHSANCCALYPKGSKGMGGTR